jgi:hypothetical protein
MPFKKGQSGNPTGKRSGGNGLTKRRRSSKLQRSLLKIAETAKSESTRVRALQLLIEHEVGKPPTQAVTQQTEKFVFRLPHVIEDVALWEVIAGWELDERTRAQFVLDAPPEPVEPLPAPPAVADPRQCSDASSDSSQSRPDSTATSSGYAGTAGHQSMNQAAPVSYEPGTPARDGLTPVERELALQSYERFANGPEAQRRYQHRLRGLKDNT